MVFKLKGEMSGKPCGEGALGAARDEVRRVASETLQALSPISAEKLKALKAFQAKFTQKLPQANAEYARRFAQEQRQRQSDIDLQRKANMAILRIAEAQQKAEAQPEADSQSLLQTPSSIDAQRRGVPKGEILGANWPGMTYDQMKVALENRPDWISRACVQKGRQGKGGGALWCPVGIGLCLVEYKGASSSFIRRVIQSAFPTFLELWEEEERKHEDFRV